MFCLHRLLFSGFFLTLAICLLPSAQGQEIRLPRMRFTARDSAETQRWQEKARALLFECLKLSDLQATRRPKAGAIPFDARIVRSEVRDKYVWSEREINSTRTRRIKIILTVPTPAEKGRTWPAVVCIHGHGGSRLVVYDRQTIYHGFAADLAERGFITVAADVGQHEVYEKGRTLMGERLWDMLRCADYLASLPEVDGRRLGCAGLSLGGEMAMWLGAMDPRLKATVSSGFLTTVANLRQGHCPCWDFPGLTENFDFSDIYSLTAPRPLLCQNGRQERAPGGFPIDLAEKAMKEIHKAYAVFQCSDRAELDIHPGGHEFVTSSGLRFLQRHLGQATASTPGKSRPDVIVYKGVYPGWPWITSAADGTLYCVFREGTVHDYSANGKVLLCRSTNHGQTWSPAQVVVETPEVDDRNAAIAVLPGGDLLVTYNTYTRSRASQAMATRSRDGGTTWTQPQSLGEPNTRTRSGVCVLANGHLLLPYYVAPGNGALAALSQDNGKNWKTARVPDTEGFIGDEWDVLEIEPGRILGLLRNSHSRTDGTFWKTESRDGGQSWAVPKPTNLRSQRHPSPPHLTRVGRTPTVIFADRRMVSVSAARPADADFLHWDLERRLPCFLYNADGSPIQDGSYPASVAVAPHRHLVVDYEIRPDAKCITGYFVTFPQDW